MKTIRYRCFHMRPLLRFIYLLIVVSIFVQCSSVREASVATSPISQHAASVITPGSETSDMASETSLLNETVAATAPLDSLSTLTLPDSLATVATSGTLSNAIVSDTLATVATPDILSNATAPDTSRDYSYIRHTGNSNSSDTVKAIDPAEEVSTDIATDSLTVIPDTTHVQEETLEFAVNYSAQDSIVFTSDNMGYLYGDADIKYGDMGIKGEFVTVDMDSSVISSTFGLDSLGTEFGHPVFAEGGMEYEMKQVKYNFETRKAFIHHVITQQGEGHIVANEAKMNADNSFYMRNAKYTTCDRHDHPHFYLNLSKAKVRPDKDVVTGPAWLVVADVPLFPVVLPFAFFPFTKSYSSGIIMPSYGDEMTRGFYLQNGGYYFALSDYIDLALTGEIYTKGSWGAGARSNYRKRYKYSGNFNVYYLSTATGERELKDVVPGAYSVAKDLRINWTHSQDPKANMYRTLSASVNFSTSKNNHRDLSRL